MKFRKADDEPSEPTESEAVEEAEEDDESSGRGPLIVLSAVIVVGAWRLVAVFPEVAYVVVGSIGTIGIQKIRAWRAAREKGEETETAEQPKPDVAEALRRLVGEGNGVLLTQLQRDLKLPNTKAVKALLEAEGIEWKTGVRTPKGNGPGVHKSAIPEAPSPADHSHGDRCCCRSGTNANTNSGEGERAGEGIRVQDIGDGGRLAPAHPGLEDLVARFFAFNEATNRTTDQGKPSE